jgi:amino-acid N-acetyltransferase
MSSDLASDRGCTSVRRAQGEDLSAIKELLQQSGLPITGVEDWLSQFLVAEHEGHIVAVAGMELYGSSALLRSVGVRPEWRGSGLGRQLVERLLATAQERGTHDVYLLTTTAEDYFPRFGFACISRDQVPEQVQDSVEFTCACPASAVVMCKVMPTS